MAITVSPLDREKRFGVVIDAGSSGSRVQIYAWPDPALGKGGSRLPAVGKNGETKKHKWHLKVHPGISTFAQHPQDVGVDHLRPLVEHALSIVPPSLVPQTPLFLLATAGMRLLPATQQTAILEQACSYARTYTKFLLPNCEDHFQVINGETEGLLGWISINYMLGALDWPEENDHGKGHSTYGFLDMGGASAQIAFAPNATETTKHEDNLMLLRLRRLNRSLGEYRVFVSTWLGFGADQAHERHMQRLLSSSSLEDPCMPKHLTAKVNGVEVEGSGSLEQCLLQTQPLLDKDAPCPDAPCLFNGTHAPAIDFDVNHFIGVSNFWHASHDVFDMGGAYDYHTYLQRVEKFCSRDWKDIKKDIKGGKWGKHTNEDDIRESCFKAAWMINVLHDGIGIPRISLDDGLDTGHNGTKELEDAARHKGFLDPFQSVDEIDNQEVSWTLGKMVLYASSQVDAGDNPAPVGYGMNVPGAMFHEAGVKSEEPWSDRLLFRRTPGFLLLATIFLVVVFLLLGRERRERASRSLTSLLKRRKSGLGDEYERVEQGEGWELSRHTPTTTSRSGSQSVSRTGSRERLA